MSFISKSITGRQFLLNKSFTYFWVICIIKLQNCSSLDGRVIATKVSKCLLSLKVSHQTLNLLSLLHVPPSHKKIYIPLSLVHLIYTAGDKCMRQNACSNMIKNCEDFENFFAIKCEFESVFILKAVLCKMFQNSS